MKTVEEFVDEFKRSEDLQDDVRDIFAEFLLSQSEEEKDNDSPKTLQKPLDSGSKL